MMFVWLMVLLFLSNLCVDIDATENRLFEKESSALLFQEEHMHVPEPIIGNRQEHNNDDDKIGMRSFAASGCCAGMIGGCFGYLASSSDFSTERTIVATIASSLASMVTTLVLLETPEVARTINRSYRSCIMRLDSLAAKFAND